MRISANSDDPGYSNFVRHKTARIFLNGIEQRRIITADDEEGWIEKAKTDDMDLLVVVNDELVIERLSGQVTIVLDGETKH